MYKTYGNDAQFLLVYIREAHPGSTVRVEKDGKELFEKIAQTETFEQRAETAKICTASLDLSIPTVVDGEDNKVNAAYAGWPDRMAVVGVDGKIAYYGGRGPSGFKPNEVDAWLKKYVADKTASP